MVAKKPQTKKKPTTKKPAAKRPPRATTKPVVDIVEETQPEVVETPTEQYVSEPMTAAQAQDFSVQVALRSIENFEKQLEMFDVLNKTVEKMVLVLGTFYNTYNQTLQPNTQHTADGDLLTQAEERYTDLYNQFMRLSDLKNTSDLVILNVAKAWGTTVEILYAQYGQ